MDWSQELSLFEDQTITHLLKHIYCDKTGKWEDPIAMESLQKYREDKFFCWKLIRSVLAGGRLGKLNMKILHCACVLIGQEETAQLFARFIHGAKDEKQLTNFLSFALTVIPHLSQGQRQNTPGLMTEAVRISVQDSRKIEEEFSAFFTNNNSKEEEEAGPAADSTDVSSPVEVEETEEEQSLERNFLQNLLLLVMWNEQSEQGSALKHIGLNLADIRGHLQEGLLNWMLDYTDLVRKQTGGTLNKASAKVLNTFFTLMLAVVPQVQLSLGLQNNILTKLSALMVSMLKFIRKEKLGTPLDGVDYFARCCSISGRIFINQTGADPTQLLRSLMDEVFGSYADLFDNDFPGSSCGSTGREVGSSLDYSRFKTIDYLKAHKRFEYSIFRELRQASFGEKSAAAVAHSGTLARKRLAPRSLEGKGGGQNEEAFLFVEPKQIRRLLFVDFVECLCLAARSPKQSPPGAQTDQQQQQFYDVGMCRFLGRLLVDRFAGDGLTSHWCWHAWEQEKELVSQYIKVAKTLDQHPVIFDFLLLLSELGFSGICFVLPLLKAMFVTLLAQLENTPLKAERVSVALLQRATQILTLLVSADFFPQILAVFQKLLLNATNHEAFVLMRDLWEFLQSTIPPPEEINKDGGRLAIEQSWLQKREGQLLVSSIVLVIQRNIASLGGLLPSIMGIIEGDKSENDWSIERELRPISMLAKIKR